MSIRDFASLISGREASVVLGTINGCMMIDGKVALIVVDDADWILRIFLTSDSLTSTLNNYQRQHTVIQALVIIAAIRVDHRVEKSRLTIATVTANSTIHLKPGNFEQASPLDFATPWRYSTEYETTKTQADTRRYTVVSLGEGKVTDDPGGNVKFDVDGGLHLICYFTRTLNKAEILSKRMSTVVITHTRLSRRTGGFHTTHASCFLPVEALPAPWKALYDAEVLAHATGPPVDMGDLLASGGWMSSPDVRASLSVPQQTPPRPVQAPPSKESFPKQANPMVPHLHDFDDEDDLPLRFDQPPKGPFTGASRSEPKIDTPDTSRKGGAKSPSPDALDPTPGKRKAVLSDGKTIVTDETIGFLQTVACLWYREGPRSRKWLRADKIVSGGEVKLTVLLHDGTTKQLERQRIAYE